MRKAVPRVSTRRLLVAGIAVAATIGVSAAASRLTASADSQDSAETGKPVRGPHVHQTITVPGQPVITRMPLELERPRRVLLDGSGTLYVADSASNKVVAIERSGKIRIAAQRLDEPSGLARDVLGNLYISNHAGGKTQKGSVVVVARNGNQQTLADKLTGPKGLAVDSHGNVIVACFEENCILRISPTAKVQVLAKDVSTPTGIAVDANDALYITNALPGTVTRISPAGKRSVIAKGLKTPLDIAFGPSGKLVVANYTGRELTQVDPSGKSKPESYLPVPPGTIGLCFERSGNLRVANWDYRFVLRIVNILQIPCPHCGQPIPVQIEPRTRQRKTPKEII